MILVFNFTPVYHHKYPIAVPIAGEYYQVINSDYKEYGGETVDLPIYTAEKENFLRNNEYIIYVELAPLSALYLRAIRE
jgi:1,4-alpha-glucan branching enzyme